MEPDSKRSLIESALHLSRHAVLNSKSVTDVDLASLSEKLDAIRAAIAQRLSSTRDRFVLAFGSDPEFEMPTGLSLSPVAQDILQQYDQTISVFERLVEAITGTLLPSKLFDIDRTGYASYATVRTARRNVNVLEASSAPVRVGSSDDMKERLFFSASHRALAISESLCRCAYELNRLDSVEELLSEEPRRIRRGWRKFAYKAAHGVIGSSLGLLALMGLGKCERTATSSFQDRSLLTADDALTSALNTLNGLSGTKATTSSDNKAPDTVRFAVFRRVADAKVQLARAQRVFARLDSINSLTTGQEGPVSTAEWQTVVARSEQSELLFRRLNELTFADGSTKAEWEPRFRQYVNELREQQRLLDSLGKHFARNEIALVKASPAGKSEPPFVEEVMRGLMGWDFVVRLGYALAYLFIVGGIIVILGQFVLVTKIQEILDKIAGQFAEKGRTLLLFSAFVVPLGLAGAIGSTYMASPRPQEANSRQKAQKTDALIFARLKKIDSTITKFDKDVELLKLVVDDVSRRAR